MHFRDEKTPETLGAEPQEQGTNKFMVKFMEARVPQSDARHAFHVQRL